MARKDLPPTPNQGVTEPLLTAEQVAGLIGMTPDYVYALSRCGRIPTITFGRTRRYRREAIERWLAELERGKVEAGNQSGRAARQRPRPGTGGSGSHAART